MTKIKKIFLWISSVVLTVAGLILIFADPNFFPDFYAPKFFGILSILWAFMIIMPGLIFKVRSLVQDTGALSPSRGDLATKKRESLINLQLAIAASVLMGAAGSLGLYQLHKIGFEYDKLIHFVVGLIITFALVNFIGRWFNVSFKKSLLLSAGLVMFGGLLWEFAEFASDLVLGTKTLGIYGKIIVKDTIMDIAMDALGIITALAILILRKRRHQR